MKKLVYLLACVIVICLVFLNVFCSPLVPDPALCTDGILNGSETDVDCGGESCGDCASGKHCQDVGDCASGLCDSGTCVDASCLDGIKNGTETDVDCGGGSCAACADGKACVSGTDCSSGVCAAGACEASACDDEVKNGDETDTDCGGSCPACGSGKHCSDDADCSSGWCDGDTCGETVLLTVQFTGTSGRVTSVPAGIDSTSTTSYLFHLNSTVTLQARTTNGSNSFFSGWSGDGTGSFHDLTITLDAPKTVIATFQSSAGANLVFVTSTAHPSTLGAAGFDAVCNALATTAGINNVAGSGFRAWVSTSTANAFTHIATGQGGFKRLDGSVVFANLQTHFAGPKYAIYHSIMLDEMGAVIPSAEMVWTGTGVGGTVVAGSTCNNWSGAGNGAVGSTHGGPGAWTYYSAAPCSGTARLYCFGVLSNAPLSIPAPPSGAKRVYLSTNAVLGNSVLSADCTGPGSGSKEVLTSTATTPASSYINPSTVYVTPSGVVVGTGADLVSGNLRTGIWERGDGTFGTGVDSVSTGSPSVSQTGTLASTCQNWTSTSGSAIHGLGMLAPEWWNWQTINCDQPSRAYCIEQ
jgi:hypothetical protein